MKIAKTLFILWFAHLFMDFFTGIWPIYKTLAKIDIAQAGLIIGISGFIGEILQLGFGYFCDKGYRKRILLIGILLASSVLFISFTQAILPCFFILLLLMIGSGAFHPSAMGMASVLTGHQKGKTVLIFASGGAIGLGISQIAFIKITSIFNGNALIVFIPVFILLMVLAFHSFPKQEVVAHSFTLKTFFAPIMHCKKPLTLLYFSQVASQALVMALYFLLPDLLQTKNCHNWLCMGGGHLCFVIGSALAMVPAGFLCDRFGQKSVMLVVVSCAITLLYFFLILQALSFAGTAVILTVLGAFIGLINPIIVSWGNRLVPESPSTVSALLMGCAWCLGNLGPAAAGIITKTLFNNSITHTLYALGVLLAFILTFIIAMPRTEAYSDIPVER